MEPIFRDLQSIKKFDPTKIVFSDYILNYLQIKEDLE